MAAESTLPTGIVTFLFTDIEGSTRLWEKHGEQMRQVLARHDTLLRSAIEDQSGHVVKSTGDGVLAAFDSNSAALRAALAAQRALAGEGWAEIAPDVVRVRMGLHCGEAQLRENDYFGTTVNKAARVMALGHGGQILVSGAAGALLDEALPPKTTLRDMGEHLLRGLSHQEHVFQIVVPDLTHEFPPLKSEQAHFGNLPAQVSSFIGRAREMAEVRAALPEVRLLTLTGPGGTGKTRLSLQVAADVEGDYRHGVWLVELAPVTDPDLVPTAVANALNLGANLSYAQTLETLTDYLREKELLLVLDNCEHLVDACARLAAHLLNACQGLTILASSREGLNVYGERTYHLPTLGLPAVTDDTAETAARSEAVQLFVVRAESVQPGFRLSDANATAVTQVVRRLDGIPLAIELAAARLKVFSIEQIAARLDDRFRLLTGGTRTALPRQQTLRALIDWSYELLDEEERSLFRWLSVFVGGWTFEAAESIAAPLDNYELLPQLVSKSLVFREVRPEDENGQEKAAGHEPRYGYLETIRQYARDRLIESGEMIAARDRHFAYYEAVAASIDLGDGPGSARYKVGQIISEADNLRAAVEWGTDLYPERVLQMAWNMMPVLADQALGALAIDWVNATLRRLEAEASALGSGEHERLGSSYRHGLVLLPMLLLLNGQLQRSSTEADRALALLSDHHLDPLSLGMLLFIKAQAGFFLDDPEASANAMASAQQLALSQRAISLTLRAQSLTVAAEAYRRDGRPDLAKAAIEDSEAALRNVGLVNLVWLDYVRLIIFLSRDDLTPGELESGVRVAAERLRRGGSDRLALMAESDWGHRLRHNGQLQEALAVYETVLGQWRTIGHRAAVANVLENIAFVDRAQDRPERAAVLLGAAERIRAEVGQDMLRLEREEYERELAALEEALPPQRLDALWAEGRSMSLDTVIDLAQRLPEA